ncbi:MAG: TIGR00341 family protein [Bacteroidota bacterium]
MGKEKENPILLVDQPAYEELKATLREFLEESVLSVHYYEQFDYAELGKDQRVYCYLTDDQVKELLQNQHLKDTPLGFLPHPKARNVIAGFQVHKDVKTAFIELTEAGEDLETDLLYCNEVPVLNYAVIGDISTLVTMKNPSRSLRSKTKRFFRFLRKLRDVKAIPLTLSFEDKDAIDTCATDLLIVQHAQNNLVSRILSEDHAINTGLFHTFVFAPRSILELLKAYIIKLLLGQGERDRKFTFLSKFKVESLRIKADQVFRFSLDGHVITTQEMCLEFRGQFRQIPSGATRSIEKEKEKKGGKVFQSNHLPSGALKKEMVRKRLPFISHASTDEYKELFTQLRENARPSQNYVVLMTLSTILATFGVFANSSPVIIGAMILAPLMAPIISLAMGVLRQDRKLIKNSLITVLVGVLVGYAFAIILTFITPINDMNTEVTSRIKPNIIDLGIAVISGAAGAYAYSKESIAKTLAGVAIAVALVPPLAVSGIGLAWGEWSVFFGAFLLLLTNLTGMVLAAALTFLFTGYSPFKLAKKGLLISSFVVLSISIPLGYGFFKVVEENRIIQSLNYREIDDVFIEHVKLESSDPTVIALDMTVDEYPTEEELQQVKQKIETIIGEDATLKIVIQLKR